MEKTFKTKIPPGVIPGQTFSFCAEPGADPVFINAPLNCVAGDYIDVTIGGSNRHGSSVVIPPPPPQQLATVNNVSSAVKCIVLTWTVFEVICFILLVLVTGMPPLLKQNMSSSCGVINPASGVLVTTLYYSLTQGFGSSPQCVNSATDFCISWLDSNAWHNFNVFSGAQNSYYYYENTAVAFQSAEGLIPAAAAFVGLALVFHVSLMLIHNKEAIYSLYVSGGLALFIAWVLALSALSEMSNSTPVNSYYWQNYYRLGYSLADLTSSTPPVPVPLATSCSVRIAYEDGGAMLSASVAILFVLFIWNLVSSCCIAPVMLETSAVTNPPPARSTTVVYI